MNVVYYNKKRKQQNNRRILVLFIFVLVAYFAFNIGKSKNQGSLNYCKSENKQAMQKVANIEAEQIEAQKNIETLAIEKNLIQEKYESLVGSEEALELFNSINSKKKMGVDFARMQRVIDELKMDRKCSEEVKKRFMVKTPLYKGEISNTNVSFEKRKFDITADGYSFLNENRQPESWFDINKPISVSFTNKNGTEVIKQTLPINKSIIMGNKEYFFKIYPSDNKGFVNISEYNCNYP